MLNDVSRQRVHQLVKSGALLAVPGPGKSSRYPSLQFTAHGELVEGLKDLRRALPAASPWVVLNFLVRPDKRLAGQRPIDLLYKGDVAAVVAAAKSYGEAGA